MQIKLSVDDPTVPDGEDIDVPLVHVGLKNRGEAVELDVTDEQAAMLLNNSTLKVESVGGVPLPAPTPPEPEPTPEPEEPLVEPDGGE